jgi:hypothetical protein
MKNVMATMAVLIVAIFTVRAQASLLNIVAYDNADLPNYAPQPIHNWAPINGGYGYGTWTVLGGAGGGGTFMEGVGVEDGYQVDGDFSFALYAGGGSFAISRPLSASITTGEFEITTRLNLAGTGPNLVSIRSGNNTGSFGSGELLSFGIVNSNQLSYTDGSGLHQLPSGDARGPVWQWKIDFNAIAGSYSGSVWNDAGGFSGVFSGSLESSGTSAGSFAVINSSSGGSQNLIFDSPTFSVPEPATLSLLVLGGLAIISRPKAESV